MKNKSVSIDTKKNRIIFVLVTVLFSLCLMLPLTHIRAAADDDDTINWDSISYEVGQVAEAHNTVKNAVRHIEYELLSFLCKGIDMFDDALQTLTGLNLYDLIKDKFNITTVVYPVAWGIASLALIIAAIMLMINADKMRMSDFYRNILVSVCLLVSLPTLVSQFSSLRKNGIRDIKSSFTEEVEYSDDGEVKNSTLGESLMSNYIIIADLSLQENKLVKLSKTDYYNANPQRAYSLPINETIDPDIYNKKWDDAGAEPPITKQTKYTDLTLEDKLSLLDDELSRVTYNGGATGGKATILSTYQFWTNTNRDDRYIEVASGGAFVFAKVGGGVSTSTSERGSGTQNIWCRYYPQNDFKSYAPLSQIFEGDTVYTDKENTRKVKNAIPYLSDWNRIDENNYGNFGYTEREDAEKDDRWYSHWEYHSCPAYNYVTIINAQMMNYMSTLAADDNIPDALKAAYSANWIYSELIRDNPSTVDELIRRIENTKAYLDDYGKELNLIEYLNLEDNYRAYVEGEKTQGKAGFVDLYTQEQHIAKENETFSASAWGGAHMDNLMYNNGYETLYHFHIEFLSALVIMLATLVCLAFALIKVTRLMFDIIFAQIVAPLVVASDMSGSGRAKQVVQNLLSCNICMIAVIFLLRLYIAVMISVQDAEYSLLVTLALTIGGAMFVIDGPDLIVKILGMDAGVKSGAAAIMSLRSGTQMVSSAVNGIAAPVKAIANTTAGTAVGAVSGIAGGFSHGWNNSRANSAKLKGTENERSVVKEAGAAFGRGMANVALQGIPNAFKGGIQGFKAGENAARSSGGIVSSVVNSVDGIANAGKAGTEAGASRDIIDKSVDLAHSFKGDKGDSGAVGTSGSTGQTGSSGASGTSGKDGKDGIDGVSGLDGHSGSDGKNGERGADGQDGSSGTSGHDGKDGRDGKDGHDGIDGNDGKDGNEGRTADIGNAFTRPDSDDTFNEPSSAEVYHDFNS